jgi:hypothetical protein
MTRGVAIAKDGSITSGAYDGYGQLTSDSGDTHESAVGFGATVYHEACWEVRRRPPEYLGASKNAPDQGFFYAEGRYDLPDPRLPAAASAGPEPVTSPGAGRVTGEPGRCRARTSPWQRRHQRRPRR